MMFETIYKTIMIMTNINDTLCELNILNFKENQNNINKLINMIRNDCIVIKLFIAKNVFALSILSMIIIFITLNKMIKSFINIFKIMQLNNIKIVIANNV